MMPFESVADLKASESFQRSQVLKSLTEGQLDRFVRVFNAAFARATRGGASLEEAEATAFAIAASSAKNAPAEARKAALDPRTHFFAVMMPEQFQGSAQGVSGAEFDFEFVRDNIGLVNTMVAGNEFNFEHQRDLPLGRVASVLLPEQVPAEVMAAMDPDTPFAVSANYYADVSDDIRKIAGVSAEWFDAPAADGKRKVLLPYSFAVSESPLNGPASGIRKLAAEKVYNADHAKVLHGESLMADQSNAAAAGGKEKEAAGALEAKLASLETRVEEYSTKAAKYDEFQAKFAALLGKKDPAAELTVTDLDAKIASLKSEADKAEKARKDLEAKYAALEAKALKTEAQVFAEALVSAGKLASQDMDAVAEDYLVNKEAALKWAARLPAVHPVVGGGPKAISLLDPDTGEDKRASLLEAIDPARFGKKAGGA